MDTPLIQQLKAHLASIDEEQFKSEWAEIKEFKFEGPSIEEFLHSID